MSLSTKIKRLREQKGWSQLDIAHRMDISQAAYNKWETGQSKPTMENLQKLADILEIDFIDLLQAQVPSIDLSNAKIDGSSYVVNSYDSTINFQPSELINNILDNQKQITKLIENQSKLIDNLLKK